MANQIGGSIVWNLDVDDSKFSAGMSKARTAAGELADNVDKQFSGIRKSISNTFEEATRASQLFATGLLAVGAATVGAAGFGIKYAADLETMTQGFVTLLGSTDKANAAISQIQRDAARTPFQFKGLVQANQMLTQVTKNAPRSEALLLNIGKALTAAGKSGDELDRVTLNLQQIANTGKITELDIRQFGYAGINILELLADYYGTTKEKAGEMVKESKNAFTDLEGAFKKAGTGAGQFAKAFETQAGTLNQVWSNFTDNLGITASALVKQTGLFDAVKDALGRLTDALGYFASPAGVQQIISFFDVIKANAPIVIGFIAGGLAPAFWALAAPIIASTISLLPFIAAGVALGAIVQFLVQEMGGWGNVLLTVQGAFLALGQAYNTYLKPGLDALIVQVQTQLLPALSQLWEQLKPILIPALQLFGQILVGVIIVALQGFIMELQFVVGAVTAVSQVISGMISFFQSLPATISAVWTSITTAITSAIQTIITAVINLPTTIANAVGQMIVSLATFLGFVVGIFVYGIPAALQATVNFFIALPGMIYSTLISLYGTIVAGWNSIWAFIRTIVPQIIQTVITWFATLPAQVGVWLDATRNRTATGFKDIWNAIINEISSWPGQLYNWGVNIANAFVDGIRTAIGHIVDAFKEGLNKAKSVIQGHSPPIAGPFKEIDVWGYNVGQAWVGGVQKAIQSLSLESPTTGFPSSSSPSVSPALARGSGSLVNVEQMNVRQDSDITDIARELGFRIETSSGYTNG